ncbi:MAG: 50S ribosomal protein L35 [Planctomycetota bacterium]|nr:50S ribosomal protein L35 [Planctomycetota bacterium]
MPKLKTSKGAAKRFKVTATGKIVRKMAGKSHLLSCKPGKKRRQLRRTQVVSNPYAKSIRQLLP